MLTRTERLALVFFPVFGLDSAGLCSAATVFLCVVVNLTLTPALLLTFKGFFSHGGFFMFGEESLRVVSAPSSLVRKVPECGRQGDIHGT